MTTTHGQSIAKLRALPGKPKVFAVMSDPGSALAGCYIAFEIENGNVYVWQGDISNCYHSVNFDAVYDLALLPPIITTLHLDIRNMRIIGPGSNRRTRAGTNTPYSTNLRKKGENNNQHSGCSLYRADCSDRTVSSRPMWPEGLMEGGTERDGS